jgi:hypothetical protein
MGLTAMILYKPSFVKIDSGIQKLTGGIYRHADRVEIAQTYFSKVG